MALSQASQGNPPPACDGKGQPGCSTALTHTLGAEAAFPSRRELRNPDGIQPAFPFYRSFPSPTRSGFWEEWGLWQRVWPPPAGQLQSWLSPTVQRNRFLCPPCSVAWAHIPTAFLRWGGIQTCHCLAVFRIGSVTVPLALCHCVAVLNTQSMSALTELGFLRCFGCPRLSGLCRGGGQVSTGAASPLYPPLPTLSTNASRQEGGGTRRLLPVLLASIPRG